MMISDVNAEKINDMETLIRVTKAQIGTEGFLDESKAIGRMLDLSPCLGKEIRLFKTVLKTGVFNSYFVADAASQNKEEPDYKRIGYYLENEFFLGEQKIKQAMDWFALLFEKNPSAGSFRQTEDAEREPVNASSANHPRISDDVLKHLYQMYYKCDKEYIRNNIGDILQLAKDGNGDAQFWAGYYYDNCYDDPVAPEHSESEAIKWYTAAAEQLNPRAMHQLGMLYELRRPELALDLFKKAAEHGIPAGALDYDWLSELNSEKASLSVNEEQYINELYARQKLFSEAIIKSYSAIGRYIGTFDSLKDKFSCADRGFRISVKLLNKTKLNSDVPDADPEEIRSSYMKEHYFLGIYESITIVDDSISRYLKIPEGSDARDFFSEAQMKEADRFLSSLTSTHSSLLWNYHYDIDKKISE